MGPWLDLSWRSPAETSDGLPQRGWIIPWICVWPGGRQAPPPPDTPCPRRLQAAAAVAPGAAGRARIRLTRLYTLLPGAPPAPATTPSVFHVALVFANTAGHWGVRSAFRLVPAAPVPPPPVWRPARLLRAGIRLCWRPAAPGRVRLERRLISAPGGFAASPQATLGTIPPPPNSPSASTAWRAVADFAAGSDCFLDTRIAWGGTYAYRLLSLAGARRMEVTSMPSAELVVPARDLFPPGPPLDLEAVASPRADGTILVGLSWLPPAPAPPTTVAGYNVYRRRGAGPWRRRNAELVLTPVFSEAVAAASGSLFTYAVAAVGGNGVEGKKSAPLSVRPPPVVLP